MKKYFKRLVYIEGDPTKQLIDLLVFLAYFSVSLYAGGFAYSLSYYSRFAIDTSILLSEQQFITLFVTKVILENFLIALISVIFIFIFVVIYYSSRYVWRAWFGFLVLVAIFYGTFILAVWYGGYQGNLQADNDWLKCSTTTPTVTLSGENIINEKYSKGGYNLLLQNEKEIYVFQPQDTKESVGILAIISKEKIKTMEVTIKPNETAKH